MKQSDTLQRFIFDNAPVRGEIIHLNKSYQEIIKQHDYSDHLKRLLGEAMVLVNMLSAIVKFKGRITIQFQSKGKLKLLLAQCNHELQMRGLIETNGEMTAEEMLQDLKSGVLVIMMDHQDSAKRYQGIVSWKGSTLSESIEGYFTNSEQLPTRIWVAVNDTQASGFLIQKMPSSVEKADDATLAEEADRQWEHLQILSQTVKSEELLTLKNETLLHRLFVEEDLRLFDVEPVEFRCTCSVERGENAILMLSPEELEEELLQHQSVVVTCEFCKKEFIFDRVDVTKILRKGGTPPSSTQIH